jgi:hypothetical protein
MLALQVTRILRGFGGLQKLFLYFTGLMVLNMIYIPVMFILNPADGYLPFLLAFFSIISLFLFTLLNRSQILRTQQIYILINGKQKTVFN